MSERKTYLVGAASYWMFLAFALSLLAGTIWSQHQPDVTSLVSLLSKPTLWALGKGIWSVVWSPLQSLATAIQVAWPTMGLLTLGLVLAFVLSHAVDKRMSAAFSRFWHRAQQRLRNALKDARREAKDAIETVPPPRGEDEPALPARPPGISPPTLPLRPVE
jgi:hypothetical protein